MDVVLDHVLRKKERLVQDRIAKGRQRLGKKGSKMQTNSKKTMISFEYNSISGGLEARVILNGSLSF